MRAESVHSELLLSLLLMPRQDRLEIGARRRHGCASVTTSDRARGPSGPDVFSRVH